MRYIAVLGGAMGNAEMLGGPGIWVSKHPRSIGNGVIRMGHLKCYAQIDSTTAKENAEAIANIIETTLRLDVHLYHRTKVPLLLAYPVHLVLHILLRAP